MAGYEIKTLSKLSRPQVEQAVDLFINGFYYIAKRISKDRALLRELFIDAFDYDMVFVCLHDDKAIGFLGVGNQDRRCVRLNIDTCIRLFGKLKGTMVYKQVGANLHEVTVNDASEGYIDFITSDGCYRGKGVATRLIKHVCGTLAYEQYSLDVFSKNHNAKQLYEHLGFVQYRVRKNPLIMLSGMGSQITMKLDGEKLKALA